MQTPNFRITVVQEVDTVEICGALKVRGAQGQPWGGEKGQRGLPKDVFALDLGCFPTKNCKARATETSSH